MDVVDNFFKEINEIAPPKSNGVWEKCTDEKTGYTYYWNTATDEVTWDTPAEYKKLEKSTTKKLFVPPSSNQVPAPLPVVDKNIVKIYKIDDNAPSSIARAESLPAINKCDVKKHKIDDGVKTTVAGSGANKIIKRLSPNRSEERPTLIAYGCSSESENEEDVDVEPKLHENKEKSKDVTSNGTKIEINKSKALSLVAGYGDDSDEEEEVEEIEKNKEETTETVTASVLFPAYKEIDVQQFCEPDRRDEESLDVKAFQRKRRIGVSLVNLRKETGAATKGDVSSDATSCTRTKDNDDYDKRPSFESYKPSYPGFKSGGVLFAKDDNKNEREQDEEKNGKLVTEIDGIRTSLGEKLRFLSEGHGSASPVQIMIIQMETLYTAMKDDSLKPQYLKKWLETTLEDLTKLEKEAAPSGWLLQWDRSHKRYYYHNQSTGESQWEYPQPDIIGDDAMDISMTPPHASNDSNDSDAAPAPPPPPVIKERSVTPPPPPIISKSILDKCDKDQPLPPGVDDIQESKPANLASELDSFYSDLAAIECTQPQTEAKEDNLEPVQPPKKKKKAKLSSGLAMKKKGVSQMVEKWKNVQKSFN